MADQEDGESYFRYEITREWSGIGANVLFYSRHRVKEGKKRVFTEKDVRTVAVILAGLIVSSVAPFRYWVKWCALLARLRMKRHVRKGFRAFSASFTKVLGNEDADELRECFGALQEARQRRLLVLCAELTRFRWNPVIEISGTDGLAKALERGNGAIIWCSSFFSQTLTGKRALYEAGFEVCQVSVAEHGFSDSSFARSFLNPLMVRTENRYLKERITFERTDTFQLAKRVSAILKRNGVVLMTNNIYSGSSFAETPLGRTGYHQQATAPVNFAVKQGAALFAMTTIEAKPLERYEALISREIELPAVGGRALRMRDTDAMARGLLQATEHLLAGVHAAPQQFMLWGRQARSIRQDISLAGSERKEPV